MKIVKLNKKVEYVAPSISMVEFELETGFMDGSVPDGAHEGFSSASSYTGGWS
jgi:hypothetical protein